MLENTRTAQVLPKGEKINKKNGSNQVFISCYLPVPIYSGVEHMGLVRARSWCWLCCSGKRNRACICTLLYPPRARSIRGVLTRRCHLGHWVLRWTLLPRTHCFLVHTVLCITFWPCPSHPQSFLNGKLCTLRSLCCIPCFTHCETMNNSSLPSCNFSCNPMLTHLFLQLNLPHLFSFPCLGFPLGPFCVFLTIQFQPTGSLGIVRSWSTWQLGMCWICALGQGDILTSLPGYWYSHGPFESHWTFWRTARSDFKIFFLSGNSSFRACHSSFRIKIIFPLYALISIYWLCISPAFTWLIT